MEIAGQSATNRSRRRRPLAASTIRAAAAACSTQSLVPFCLTMGDFRPTRFSCSLNGRTTRKPTNVASVSHQMLCGRCGSCSLQSLFEARRRGAAQRHGVVVPRAAADHVGILLQVGQDHRPDAGEPAGQEA